MTFKCRKNCNGLRAAGKIACPHCLRHVPRHLLAQIAASKTAESRAGCARRIYDHLDKYPPPPAPLPVEQTTGEGR